MKREKKAKAILGKSVKTDVGRMRNEAEGRRGEEEKSRKQEMK